LIYLGVQIREQTKERRQSAVHALTEQWGYLTESLHDNAETSEIFLRGLQSFADLDAVSHCQGILTGSWWRAVERTMNDLIAYPGVQQWWEVRRHWHT
jgi:hypothetical protein